MTETQEKALSKMQKAHPKPVVMHVGTGSALVRAGKAVKTDTTGHGKLMAEYRLA